MSRVSQLFDVALEGQFPALRAVTIYLQRMTKILFIQNPQLHRGGVIGLWAQ